MLISESQFKEIRARMEAKKEECKKGDQLYCVWVGIKYPKNRWREAKALGAKKDSYWGWIVYSGSVNSNGFDLIDESDKIAQEYGLFSVCRYL